MSIYKVSEALKEQFIEKVSKIIKKGKKLGVEVSYSFIKEYFEKRSENGKTIIEKFFDFEVIGETPQIKGYDFIAICEFDGEYNLIKKNPFVEVEIPEKFKTYRECDHCNFKRNRKHTVVLRNSETEEFISVGKSCVKDFLGCDDPHNIALFLRSFDEFQEDSWIGFGHASYYEIEQILAFSNSIINKFGFVSKAKARENEWLESTAERVMFNLNPPRILTSEMKKDLVKVEKGDFEQAKTIIEWFKKEKQDVESSNNYVYNLSVLMNNEYAHYKNLGLIVSLVSMYNREMDKIEYEKTERKISEWVGKEKERREFNITVENIYTTEGYYGFVAIYSMIDENGNKISWKTNDDSKMEKGKSYNITGTIKDHSEWKNIKQTNLTRVKVNKEI